jgi:hypothetical protein
LHILIGQGSALVRTLQKATRGAAGELRDGAQALIHALDAAHPDQSAIQQILALVRKLTATNRISTACAGKPRN